jgi:phosphatidylinositol-3-phosphatase
MLGSETQGPLGVINIDWTHSYNPNANTVGLIIADELEAAGKPWKSYQENLPVSGADHVNYSDGFYTNNTDFTAFNQLPPGTTPFTNSQIVQDYCKTLHTQESSNRKSAR